METFKNIQKYSTFLDADFAEKKAQKSEVRRQKSEDRSKLFATNSFDRLRTGNTDTTYGASYGTSFTDCTEEYSHEFDVDGLGDFGLKMSI